MGIKVGVAVSELRPIGEFRRVDVPVRDGKVFGEHFRDRVFGDEDGGQYSCVDGGVSEKAELGLFENVKEMNLENNRLHGEIPFSEDFAARGKLKLEGNAGLCVDSEKKSGGGWRLGSFAACGTKKRAFPNAVAMDLS
ncbi:hypothetical protein ACLOJK_008033, partial [Asimina triloba]